jgi:hypothetical protein
MCRSHLPQQSVIDRAQRMAVRRGRPVAPATYAGRWVPEPGTKLPAWDMWNLTESIPGHCKGSTVSSMTLLLRGYRLPPVEAVR